LVGLLVVFLPKELPWWAVAGLLLAAGCLSVLIVLEVVGSRGRRVFAKGDSRRIREYMHAWIEHGGRVAVWTRDMSWAQNPETRGLLLRKAGQGELILCLPEENALSRELKAAGAQICAYGSRFLESPAARFTISFYGRGGARVAVGHTEGDFHVIEECDASSHPAFYLAEDLVGLVRAQHDKRV
jgi:hypothetical protein